MSGSVENRADGRVECADGSACSLWWTEVPAVPGERLGCIGTVLATNSQTDLVERALRRLREEGCTMAAAPMDGNTWRSYRFVTGGSKAPAFFLEPCNPGYYPELLQNAGFAALSRYSSSLVDLEEDRFHSRVRDRLERRGVIIREIDPGNFEAELERLYHLSLAAFADNFLYTPVSLAEFGELYEKVSPLVVPEYVRFAEVDGQPVAFVFALPDYLEQRRTGQATTLVVKTLATHPEWRHLGIGSVLVGQVQAAARARGFTRAIHALQHEANSSLKITRRNQGCRFREYALFARSLR